MLTGLALMLLSVVPAAKADLYDPADWSPMVWSDKADYAPGEQVTLSGAHWQPGETVHIRVNDDTGASWDRDVDVTADETGGIVDEFNLPNWFVAQYRVTATGASGAVATHTFTDADAVYDPTRVPASGNRNVTAGQSFTFDMAAGKQGSGSVQVPSGFDGSNVAVSAASSGQCTAGGAQLPDAWVRVASSTEQIKQGQWELPGNTNNKNFTFEVAVPSGAAAGAYKGVVKFVPANGGGGNGFALCVQVESAAPVMQDQTITFAAPSGVTYGAADVTLGATASSGQTVSYSSSTSSVCTIAGGKAHVVGAGTCTVTASQAGNATWNPAPNVTRSFTVAKASLTATADGESREYGDENPAFTGQLEGVKNGDEISVSGSTTATKQSPVGEYAIVPVLSAGEGVLGNYDVTKLNGTLTVTKAPLTATANGESREYGDENPTFTGQLDGVKNGDEISVSGSTTATKQSPVGEYAIVPVLSADAGVLDNYDVTKVNGTLTVTKAPLSVTAADKTRVYGDENPDLTGTLTGVKNDDPISATYETAATKDSDVGEYPIVASLEASEAVLANYGEPKLVDGTLRITKASQSITFPAVDAKKLGDADFDPRATASSGLPVSYAAAPATVCSVVDGKVRILGVGTCSVTASQAGNGNYNAAPAQPRSFAITYVFTGFFQPIDMGANVLNKAKAGSTIPVKFRLNGNQGLGILAAGSPGSGAIVCDTNAIVDTVEELATTTTSGLKYDALADQYIYNWKTDAKFTGCRQLVVALADGTSYRANFTFTK